MITIQIENNSEQSATLIKYLETLSFVTFIDLKNITPEATVINEVNEANEKEELTEETPVVQITQETIVHDKPTIVGTGGNTFSETFEKLLLTDLKKSLNLNDKFRFQRDLFHGSNNEMNQTLERLNNCSSFSEAWDYVETKFRWDAENESVVAFKILLEKRFS